MAAAGVLASVRGYKVIGSACAAATAALLTALVIPQMRASGLDAAAMPAWRGVSEKEPGEIWMSLYRHIRLRSGPDENEYGADELDPLLWANTQRVLTGESHRRAIQLLDRFLEKHAERAVRDPLRRALLQRELWAVFDWSAQRADEHTKERRALQTRLAEAIRRLALTPKEIEKLPETYAEAVKSGEYSANYDVAKPGVAFLPANLFDEKGPWVCLSRPVGGVTAHNHVEHFSGRSVFLVFMRMPGGRAQTIGYLKQLREFVRLSITDALQLEEVYSNPDVPRFPVGTQVALVRQMVLPDARGKLVVTPVTENVQLRVTRAAVETIVHSGKRWQGMQDVFELKIEPAKALEGARLGLRAIAKDEKEFPTFRSSSHGFDPFENPREAGLPERHRVVRLNTCKGCHEISGTHPAMTLSFRFSFAMDGERPGLAESTAEREINAILWWKVRRYDWGLLNGMWEKR